jgi:two-component system chemotaxis sensor kinase CheA
LSTRSSQSLRSKFVRTLLLVTGLTGVAALAIIVGTSAQTSAEHVASAQRYIEEGITSKGRILTENHARALRGLTLDNAFLDMQRLVARAVDEDADVVYGLYVNTDGDALAFGLRGSGTAKDALPEKDAWRRVQIPDLDLLVRATTITRTVRFGQDVVEVAVPVSGEDGEMLGTIRYGLSTARMHAAIAGEKAAARARLWRSVVLVGSLVTFAAALGLLLSRMQAVRITRPIAELTTAAKDLASGNRAVHVQIESGDELETLGASFNRMVHDLDASYRQLEEMNRTLEHKVEERTIELARRNLDMRLVLDNVDQGLITLGMDGVMALERSGAVDQWFGAYAGGVRFVDYVREISPSFAVEFELAWDQVLEDVLPLNTAIDQMPRRLVYQGRTFSLRYLPFHRDGQLEGVLLVLAEITERLAKEREDAEQSELMESFKRLMLDRTGMTAFLREAGRMIDDICSRRLEGDKVLHQRTLHTLKGNAASMGLTVVARICHGLEEKLGEGSRIDEEALTELADRWHSITAHVATLTGHTTERVIEVPESEYTAVLARLTHDPDVGRTEVDAGRTQVDGGGGGGPGGGGPGGGRTQVDGGRTQVVAQMRSWQLEPITKPLRRLADQARGLARRLGRGEIQVDIEDGGVRVHPDATAPLFAELAHMIRNAVDHGLERPNEREANGKPRQGRLTMKAALVADLFTLEISDDGRGIDWDTIATKALALGLPHTTPAHLLQALCTDGVTSRSEVSDTSGRGIGMAALKQRIEALSGRLEVRSKRGVGTTFVIRLPWSAESGSPNATATPAPRGPSTTPLSPAISPHPG